MQEELKELVEKVRPPCLTVPRAAAHRRRWDPQKKRGEYSSDSALMNRIMEHQEKRNDHEAKMADIQLRIAKELAAKEKGAKKLSGEGGDGGGAGEGKGAEQSTLRQRKGAAKD